jgi:polar amino acid transport system ATP-binding protein
MSGRPDLSLSLRQVTKSFGDHVVLDRIDLDVAPSEVICLIGASGSGKSTLLRCVNLLEPIDDGIIEFDGLDISEPGLDPDPIRRRIGMVFQSYNLFQNMSVLENVAAGPRLVLGRPKRVATDLAIELLERLGLLERANAYPEQLSGGQQQRVAIARALALDPEVMLLDEITSALDPELVGEVLDVVRSLKAAGMTMMIATHEMGFAREIADRVCFLDRGRVLETGLPEDIFSAPVQPRTQQFLQRIVSTGRLR